MSRGARSGSGASKERERRRSAARRSTFALPSSDVPASGAARGVETERMPASPPSSGQLRQHPRRPLRQLAWPLRSLAGGVGSRSSSVHEVRSPSGAPLPAGIERGSRIVRLVRAGRR